MITFLTTAQVPDTAGAIVSRTSGQSGAVLSGHSNAKGLACLTQSDLLHFNSGNRTLTKVQSKAIHTHLLHCRICRERMRLAVDAFEDIMRALTLRLPSVTKR